MTELKIPQTAYDAGESALSGYPFASADHLDAASDVLHAAAPLIVAAELRRLAAELYDGPQRWPASKVALIRARADELEHDRSGD